MRRNPLLPFLFIAIVAIVAMVILSFQGNNKATELANSSKLSEEVASNPEDIVMQTCVSCHGENLKGSMGPDLTKVGSKYSTEEIKDILLNGKGTAMPAGLVTAEQANEVAKWLAETHK